MCSWANSEPLSLLPYTARNIASTLGLYLHLQLQAGYNATFANYYTSVQLYRNVLKECLCLAKSFQDGRSLYL